jgi:hypothetical protein
MRCIALHTQKEKSFVWVRRTAFWRSKLWYPYPSEDHFVSQGLPARFPAHNNLTGVMPEIDFASLHTHFQSPIAALDCGERCAVHNERGVPFCCDLQHAIPTAYLAEWEYLQVNTDLWRPWEGGTPGETERIRRQTPDGQMPIACKGHLLCQRGFRSITCRSFPFFPYITRQGEFTGLAYYWEYEDRCWVISNLSVVTPQYRAEFIAAFDALFAALPDDRENFRQFSSTIRRVYGHQRRAILLLHRNGQVYKVTPRNGRMRRVDANQLPAFGPYRIAAQLPFPDEILPKIEE